MRLIFTLCFILVNKLVSSECHVTRKDLISLNCAMENMTRDFFALNKEFSIIDFNSDIGMITGKNEHLPLRVIKIDKTKYQSFYKVRESAIMTFGVFQSVQSFNKKATLINTYSKPLRFIMYWQNASINEISHLEDTAILQYQYFLVDEPDYLKLMTFVWYTPQKCNTSQLIEVNRFDKNTRMWQLQTFSIDKFHSFHRCLLVFGAAQEPPAFAFYLDDDFTIKYWGYNLDILKALQRNLNFRFKLNPYAHHSRVFGYDLAVDLLIVMDQYNFNPEVFAETAISHPYVFLDNYLLIPEGANYTSYEKLICPFDSQVWTWIIVTFVSALTTIFIFSHTKPQIQNFVFGRNVTSPTLTFTMIFFGISQTKVPGRNFARYLVAMFLLFCMVIRTGYQGKMFEFMQKTMTKPEVKSINEMIEKNFTFHMTQGFSDVSNGSEFFLG